MRCVLKYPSSFRVPLESLVFLVSQATLELRWDHSLIIIEFHWNILGVSGYICRYVTQRKQYIFNTVALLYWCDRTFDAGFYRSAVAISEASCIHLTHVLLKMLKTSIKCLPVHLTMLSSATLHILVRSRGAGQTAVRMRAAPSFANIYPSRSPFHHCRHFYQ